MVSAVVTVLRGFVASSRKQKWKCLVVLGFQKLLQEQELIKQLEAHLLFLSLPLPTDIPFPRRKRKMLQGLETKLLQWFQPECFKLLWFQPLIYTTSWHW